MLGRCMLSTALLVASTLVGLPCSFSAQFQTPNPVTCPKGIFENDDPWARRCHEEDEQQLKNDAAGRQRAMMRQLAETQRQVS